MEVVEVYIGMPPTHSVVLRKIEDLSLTQTAAEDKDVKLTQAVKDMPIYTVCAHAEGRLWVEAILTLCLPVQSIAARRDHISHFILRLAFAEK